MMALFGFAGLHFPRPGVLLTSNCTPKEIIFEWGSGQQQAVSELQKAVSLWQLLALMIHSHMIVLGFTAHTSQTEVQG